MKYYVNGSYVDAADASIHVSDLGLLRGYGIFDFLRCIGDQPMFLEDHLDRFYASASKMDLKVPLDRDKIKSVIGELLSRNSMESSGIRIVLTGGSSSDGYTKEGSTIILTQEHIPVFSGIPDEKGVKLATYEYQRMLPDIKTTNYIIGVLQRKWCEKNDVNDLLFHINGVISELPRSNFFIVDKEGVLSTPEENILFGVTRKNILKYASEFMEVQERPVHLDELHSVKEAFFTGTGKRIIPVGSIDGILINNGETGPVAKKLIQKFHALEDALVKI